MGGEHFPSHGDMSQLSFAMGTLPLFESFGRVAELNPFAVEQPMTKEDFVGRYVQKENGHWPAPACEAVQGQEAN